MTNEIYALHCYSQACIACRLGNNLLHWVKHTMYTLPASFMYSSCIEWLYNNILFTCSNQVKAFLDFKTLLKLEMSSNSDRLCSPYKTIQYQYNLDQINTSLIQFRKYSVFQARLILSSVLFIIATA